MGDFDFAEKFFRKIRKTETCWLWESTVNAQGYGSIHKDGRSRLAHRIAYELYVGKIPEGALVRHSCDNTLCVNPKHLSLGTHQDNKNDAVFKGRHSFGSSHGKAKLDERLVREIRDLQKRYSIRELSILYEVSTGTIRRIVDGKGWKHVV